MSEIVYPIISAVIGVLTGALGSYVVVKRIVNSDIIDEKASQIFTNVINMVAEDTELQKKVYIVGGILGQGIVAGSGLQKLTGGSKQKGGLEGIIMQLVGGFIQNKVGGMIGGGQQPQEQGIAPFGQ